MLMLPVIASLTMKAARPATLEVRKDGPGVTLDQARKMPPDQLADMLLAPGHPKIESAMVGRMVVRPPPPPGIPRVTVVRLYTAAQPSTKAGFCERKVAAVSLKPVYATSDGIPPAAADFVTVETVYKWHGPGKIACGGIAESYFDPVHSKIGDRAFDVIRMFSALQRASWGRIPKGVTVSVSDTAAPVWRAYAKGNAGHELTQDDLTTLTDGRKALVDFPLEDVTWVIDGENAGGNPLTAEDMRANGPTTRSTYLWAGIWAAGVVVSGGKITTVRIRKAIPPSS